MNIQEVTLTTQSGAPHPAGKPFPLRTTFPLGVVVATHGVMARVAPGLQLSSLKRHAAGDWGDVDKEDRDANASALRNRTRLLSVYKLTDDGDPTLWIITEGHRQLTTLLLPEEY